MPSTRWPTRSRSRKTGGTPATWWASSSARWRRPATCACSITSRPTTMPGSPRCWRRRGAWRRSPARATPSRSRPPGTEWRSSSSAMTASRPEPGVGRFFRLRKGRLFGFLLVLVLAGICAMPYFPGLETLRLSWFDICQRASPRVRAYEPVVIVDVDGPSLAEHGQWPWPRTLLATLLDRIAAGNPAAIGLDIMMPDQDRLSPQRLPKLIRTIGPELAAQLAALPSNDAVLAAAIRGRPVVLAIAGSDKISEPGSRGPGRMVPVRSIGGDAAPFLRQYDAMVRTVTEI